MNDCTTEAASLKSHVQSAATAAARAATDLQRLVEVLGEGDLKLVRASPRVSECPTCRLGFVPASRRAVYCRDRCRAAATYARKKG